VCVKRNGLSEKPSHLHDLYVGSIRVVLMLWSEDTGGAVACATRCPDASTACARLDQLVGHSNPAARYPGPRVTLVRNRTVAKFDSTVILVRS
jgi:hypothetical protein